MHKSAIRLLAVSLISCLVVDPVTATAFSSSPSNNQKHLFLEYRSAEFSAFQEQALAARLRQFFHERELDQSGLSFLQEKLTARAFRSVNGSPAGTATGGLIGKPFAM